MSDGANATVFGPIWDWFGNIALPWFRDLFLSTGRAVIRVLTPQILTFVAIWKVIKMMVTFVSWAIVELHDSMMRVDFAAFVAPDSTLLVYGAFMNRFLPLTETFAIVILMVNLCIVVILVRWFKSFLPSISN